ncbi:hypothetical protein HKBW3S09_00632 [Candidatus Hakubella thermalkaliphila]|uniref:DUF6788 domain-containing protein n=2 Tax=Candidatus Hakubella thermalkaliphila TaxID=2754717 RepID=A0A6V8NS77_9ACTN|nr:hypothetical protein HKBW3S09_00632 [Candidatus Hakubella thermalkaliphila]
MRKSSGNSTVSQKSRLQNRMEAFKHQQRSLKEELWCLGFLMSGSVSKRMITCGNSSCACRKDPAARHGPYIYWTTKRKGKTVARLIKNEEAQLYMEWVQNRKKLNQIIRKWTRLSERTFKTALQLRLMMKKGPKGSP